MTEVYASNPGFHRATGDFPAPGSVTPEQVASSVAAELAHPAAEVLPARDDADASLVGLAVTLAEHPDPADPFPWIGLLMVHGSRHRSGLGREIAGLVEERLRARGRGVRLAVLDSNPGAPAFWRSLGHRVIDHREDRRTGRPCSVLHKNLPPGPPRTIGG
ncbi:GNAT family N-acetyltransferase [Actinacidiphila glaucinigra]|uniref:GNAT family N-acetyltransferase n=1 Tax=Actinacidiphila glaucinigra TaxID=235986 RepID=UPI002E32FB77|nr:GNAT family N-acetyltransferase [Actinacidiphila glaucinigra]